MPLASGGAVHEATGGDGKRPQWLSYSAETYVSIGAAVGILIHLTLRFISGAPASVSEIPLIATLLLGGLPLLLQLSKRLLTLDFGADLLAGLAILTAVLLHQYLVGAIIVLMLSGGNALENFATRRASSALAALAHRMPQVAHRLTSSGFVDIELDTVTEGDRLLVLPHEFCPADGVVVEGHGTMDESYLTGEPFRISKAPGSDVISGAINGDAALTIKVTKPPADSRYASIIRVMEESEQKRPRIRRIADRLGSWYTVLALLIAGTAWYFSSDAQRFLAVLVIATPCPLLIAIPVAMIGGISRAARHGIIVKDPVILEQIDHCRTVILDKTGTLTYGKPVVTEIICAPGYLRQDVLTLAASLEQYSKHPLSSAIVEAAVESKAELLPVSFISEKPGEGLRGMIEDKSVQITSRSKMPPGEWDLPPVTAGLECVVVIDGLYAATIRFHDAPRAESRPFIDHLGPNHQVNRVILLSGDRESEVRYLAKEVGIDEFHSGKSPEEKVAIVERETRLAKTLYIGDGINDAPAMMAATAAIALGQRSDVTSEAAGAVVLDASLRKVDELAHIGRRMRRIALESAGGGMALSMAGMAFAATGYLSPLAGAVSQELIDIAAVLNALRVTIPIREYADF
jgi:heavy metal translocating P-type ATPase